MDPVPDNRNNRVKKYNFIEGKVENTGKLSKLKQVHFLNYGDPVYCRLTSVCTLRDIFPNFLWTPPRLQDI